MDLTHVGLDARGQMRRRQHAGCSRTRREAAELFERLVANIARVVQGNDEAIRLAVTCLVAGGHLLVEDVPGVGKTSLGKALAASVSCRHRRIQFTSDLLPSDVTGVSVFDVDEGKLRVPAGADLRQHRSRRRDQPDAPEDPVRPARVDGGAAGHCRRGHLPAAGSVHGDRHPEPDRARGDLPAPRQPARPLPAQDPDRLPRRRVGGRRCSRPTASTSRSRCCRPVATPEDVLALAATGTGRPHLALDPALHRRRSPMPPERTRPSCSGCRPGLRSPCSGRRGPGRCSRVATSSRPTTSRRWRPR